jgi:hypothetical protein
MRKLIWVVLLAVAALPAFADDVYPPPWTRGGERTTFQRWEFSTPSTDPAPDEVMNPFGTPTMSINGNEWLAVYDNREGVWALPDREPTGEPESGTMNITIPNAPDNPTWSKMISLQLTWEQEGTVSPIIFADNTQGQLIETDAIGGLPEHPWFHSTWLISLPYNPEQETVHIGGDLMIDEVVVDTICTVPEPATMSLLALGGWVMLRRRISR